MLVEGSSGVSERLLHKNRLQEYAQKSAIALPLYYTTNRGQPHLPQFVSCVYVNGMIHDSSQTFPNRKAAEQDAARVALEYIHDSSQTFPNRKAAEQDAARVALEYILKTKTTTERDAKPNKTSCNQEKETTRSSSSSAIQKESPIFKSVLYEYGSKLKLEKPMYKTVMTGQLHCPGFYSSVDFDGITYTGGIAKNKAEAEQKAAQKVVETLLSAPVSSDAEKILLAVLKSKEESNLTSEEKSCGAPAGPANGASSFVPWIFPVLREVNPHACSDASVTKKRPHKKKKGRSRGKKRRREDQQ